MENTSAWCSLRSFVDICYNGRHLCITLIVIEPKVRNISHIIRENMDVYVDPHTVFNKALYFEQQKQEQDNTPFVFQFPRLERSLFDMSTDEQEMRMHMFLSMKDAPLTSKQAIELFRISHRNVDDFEDSRFLPTLTAYLAQIECMKIQLLEVTNTSYGHLPNVLCELIVDYI